MSKGMLGLLSLSETQKLRDQLEVRLASEEGRTWADELKLFLRRDPCWTKKESEISPLTESEKMAVGILGSGKVVGYYDVKNAWNITMPGVEPTMPFSEATLKECAEENKKGADWRVIWINGFSLRKQEEIRGRNRKNPPCFDPDYTWWPEKAQDSWGTQSIESGYQLLNFKRNLPGITWQSRENEIAKLGEYFERAEEQAVTEACLSIYMIKKERLLKDWYHQGRLQPSSDNHVCVGYFDERGFHVHCYWDVHCGSFIGVVLSRKS